MALADLASRQSNMPVALSEIAKSQQISLSYLEQLFAKLRRAGLVRSARGPGGGYSLSRGAHETSVAAIMRAVDEPIETSPCAAEAQPSCGPDGTTCVTHELWSALSQEIEAFLAAVSLADVVTRRIPGMRPAPEPNPPAVAAPLAPAIPDRAASP